MEKIKMSEEKKIESEKEQSITIYQLAITIGELRKSLSKISMPADAHNEVQQVISNYFKIKDKST